MSIGVIGIIVIITTIFNFIWFLILDNREESKKQLLTIYFTDDTRTEIVGTKFTCDEYADEYIFIKDGKDRYVFRPYIIESYNIKEID